MLLLFVCLQTCVLKVNIHCDGCKQKVKKLLLRIEGAHFFFFLIKILLYCYSSCWLKLPTVFFLFFLIVLAKLTLIGSWVVWGKQQKLRWGVFICVFIIWDPEEVESSIEYFVGFSKFFFKPSNTRVHIEGDV